jgi:hypothetical protein
MRPTDTFHLIFDSRAYILVHRRKSSVGDMCYLTLAKILSTRYGTPCEYRMEIKTVSSNGDGESASTFKVKAQCCVEDSKATPRDGFVVVPEDRAVEVAVMFFPRPLRRNRFAREVVTHV